MHSTSTSTRTTTTTTGTIRRNDDQGSAILSVFIIAAFVFGVASMIGIASMFSMTVTGQSQNNVQVVSHAESGRDVALANVIRSFENGEECVPEELNEDRGYSYAVFHATSEDAPSDTTEPGVEPGCPEQGASHILIESTGHSERANPGLTDKTIVSVFELDGDPPPPNLDIQHSIAAYGSVVFAGGVDTLDPTNTSSIVVSEGRVQCHATSVVVESSIYILAASSEPSSIGNCRRIEGDFVTAGDLFIRWNDKEIVEGDLCVEGTLNADNHTLVHDVNVRGSVTHGGGPGSCPILDAVRRSSWVDFAPDPAQSVSPPRGVADLPNPLPNSISDGGNPRAWLNYDMCSGTRNSHWDAQIMKVFISALTEETVIDYRDCGVFDLNFHSMGEFEIQTSVTLVADRFHNVDGLRVRSADDQERHFNFIVPDEVFSDPAQPDCEGRAPSSFFQLNYEDPSATRGGTSGLVYSPCSLNESDGFMGNFRGQIYAGGSGLFAHTGGIEYANVTPPRNAHEEELDNDDEQPFGLVSTIPVAHLER